MSNTGVCKSFNGGKGWGFISFEDSDIFVHIKECVDGMQPQKDDILSFDLEEGNQGKMIAKNVSGGTNERETPGAKGKGKGGAPQGAFTATVKSFVESKGYGFIDYEGQDVFLHSRDVVGGTPERGDTVYFDMEESKSKPGQMIAKNVSGGTGRPGGGDSYGASWGGKDDWGGKGGWGSSPYGGGKAKGKDAWGGKGGWDSWGGKGGKDSWDKGGKGGKGGKGKGWEGGWGGDSWGGKKGWSAKGGW